MTDPRLHRFIWPGLTGLAILLLHVLFSCMLDEPEENRSSAFSARSNAVRTEHGASESSSGVPVVQAGTQPGVQPAERTPAPASSPDPLFDFKDTRIPLSRRMDRIRQLGISGDSRSREVLVALGDARTFLNWAAVEALGNHTGPEVASYLRDKLHDENHQVVRAAIKSYARVTGDDAAAELVRLLQANHRRADGYDEEICSDIVDLLGNIRSPLVTEALVAELERCNEPGWSLAYGSLVVEALGKSGSIRARQVLLRYAESLARMQPRDPLAGKYVQDKIAEARRAAAAGD